MEITVRERLESLKAGALASLAFISLVVLSQGLSHFLGLASYPLSFLSLGSSLLSGFLFGVTYRYIIRRDQNSHLRDGAVLAFALVRAGGYGDGLTDWLQQGPLLALFVLESIIGFAVARSGLDLALARQWLRPFSSIDPEL
jgi:hypothetical protein